MKRRLSVVSKIVATGIVSLFTLASVSFTDTAEAKELRFVHAYPVASQHHRNVQWFTSEVTKRSNGDITFQVFPSAQTMPINQELPAIRAGQVSMTYTIAPVVTSVEPLWGVFDLPFLFDVEVGDIGHAYRFFKSEKGGGVLAKAMEARGFKLLAIAVTDMPSGIYLTRNEPVRSLEDLRGLKLRYPGGQIGQKAGEAFGYDPIAITGAELVPALTQGIVDGAVLPPIYAHDNELPVNSLLQVPVTWAGVTPLIMSLAEYQSLTESQQNILNEVAKELEDRSVGIVEASAGEKLNAMAADGKSVVELSPEESARWRERAEPVWDFFVEQNGDAAKTMIDEAIRLRDAAE